MPITTIIMMDITAKVVWKESVLGGSGPVLIVGSCVGEGDGDEVGPEFPEFGGEGVGVGVLVEWGDCVGMYGEGIGPW